MTQHSVHSDKINTVVAAITACNYVMTYCFRAEYSGHKKVHRNLSLDIFLFLKHCSCREKVMHSQRHPGHLSGMLVKSSQLHT